jgi:adenylosuccinate lyase
MQPEFETYLSPFTWRYGSPEMRAIWSEDHKRRLWRRLWVALAEVQAGYGLVTPEQLEDLRAHAAEVDMRRSLEIEAEIHHDLMAELRAFAEQSRVGGGALHLGATSTDIEDNAEVLRMRQSLDLLLGRLGSLLDEFALMIETWADEAVIAFTHLQPAEPTTFGYRLALYAQDLLEDWRALGRVQVGLRGKGFKGAVGSGAAYAELLGEENLENFERRLSELLGLEFFPVASQVYPRKQDYEVACALAGLGASLYKFAFDLRILQSPPFGELSEPFGAKQVGSSAMPFKRNPVRSEKIDSLGRLLAQMPRLAWDNAAHSLLERTLDDSANRRSLLAEMFLCADELLIASAQVLGGLQVDRQAMRRNLEVFGPFAAIERVLMALVKVGADRQAMHELLRQHAMNAWEAIRAGQPNPLAESLAGETRLLAYLREDDLRLLMDASRHLGNAAARARRLAAQVRGRSRGSEPAGD